MNRAIEELAKIDAAIATEKETNAALKIRQARGKEEEIRYFESLDSESRRQLFDDNPEAYEAVMDAITRRNERRFFQRGQR